MAFNPDQKRIILAVLAHPDDESFGMGGTLAKYAEQGVEIHLICATRGEVGEMPEDCLEEGQSIAERREQELRCAARELGISHLHLLDYRDSGMLGSPENQHPRALIKAPEAEVTKQVKEIIREVKPQIVLTFDPIGGYRHPDHIAMHHSARNAFYDLIEKQAGRPESERYLKKLYYHTISRRFIRLNVRILRLLGKDPSRWGKNQDIDLTQLAVDDFPTHARINYKSVADKKSRAAACHASQGGGGFTKGYLRWFLWLMGVRENDQFMQAYPEPENGVVLDDFFSDM
jgi:LmbE family N-acetylglucosaminyl deacetylase